MSSHVRKVLLKQISRESISSPRLLTSSADPPITPSFSASHNNIADLHSAPPSSTRPGPRRTLFS